MYLGNNFYNNIYTIKIDELVCDFERRSNHIMQKFSMCDSSTLKHIFSTYCESFYGCELFNFTKPYNVKLYVIFVDCLLELIIILYLIWEMVL